MVDSVVGPDDYPPRLESKLAKLAEDEKASMRRNIETLAKIGQLKRF